MKVFRNIDSVEPKIESAGVTVGNFDGVHLGHRQLLKRLREYRQSSGGPAVVVTFSPHPVSVLDPDLAPPCITSDEDKLSLFEREGVDFVVMQKFDPDFAAMPADEFVRKFFGDRIKAGFISVGHDFSFGYKRQGNIGLLHDLSPDYGFEVHEEPPFRYDGRVVSSTKVRNYLHEGKVRGASLLLGRQHEIEGTVIKGDQRGRTLGFPTANIGDEKGMMPSRGVYACMVKLVGDSTDRVIDAVVNIGTRPTFGKRDMLMEAHLFDFDQDIYGRRIRVAFVRRVRQEKNFSSVDELVEQIKRDCQTAKEYIAASKAGDPAYRQPIWLK